jgi:hypothetical protein
MKLENTSNLSDLDVNFLEYCIIEEDTYLPTDRVKVKIPKLTINTSDGTLRADKTILINDNECKPTVGSPIKITEALYIKTFSGLELSKCAIIKKEECGCTFHPCGGADFCTCSFTKDCKGGNTKFIDGHIVEAYLPKGAQMIVCFMEKNINDAYLTNFI